MGVLHRLIASASAVTRAWARGDNGDSSLPVKKSCGADDNQLSGERGVIYALEMEGDLGDTVGGS